MSDKDEARAVPMNVDGSCSPTAAPSCSSQDAPAAPALISNNRSLSTELILRPSDILHISRLGSASVDSFEEPGGLTTAAAGPSPVVPQNQSFEMNSLTATLPSEVSPNIEQRSPAKEVDSLTEALPPEDSPNNEQPSPANAAVHEDSDIAAGLHVFAWGRGDVGQLGNGSEESLAVPTLVEGFEGKAVVSLAANLLNTAALTEEGDLYTCGANDNGQLGLGRKALPQVLQPIRVDALDAHKLRAVAVGGSHMVVLADDGQAMFSWGAGDFGQLGQGSCSDTPLPRSVKRRQAEGRWLQVVAGEAHSLALASNGDVYAWGQGSFGALGIGGPPSSVTTPTFVPRLWAVGVVQVSCGDAHSAALCKDGRLFCWGRNKYGQLGLGDCNNALLPTHVSYLARVPGRQVSCGGDHTLLVGRKGGVWSWGRSNSGQTGHGSRESLLFPQRVEALKGKRVVQVAAGSRHSLALTGCNQIWAWGADDEGQCGQGKPGSDELLPVRVLGLPGSVPVAFIVAGGEHSMAVLRQPRNGERRRPGPLANLPCGANLIPLQLPPLIALVCDAAQDPSSSSSIVALRRAVEDVMSSPAFLRDTFSVASMPEAARADMTPKLLAETGWSDSEDGMESDEDTGDADIVEDVSSGGHGIDIYSVDAAYSNMLRMYNKDVLGALGGACSRLLDGVLAALQHGSGIPQSEYLHALFILVLNPLNGESWGVGADLVSKMAQVVTALVPQSQKTLERWVGTLPREIFGGRVVRPLQRYLTRVSRQAAVGGVSRGQLLLAGKLLGHMYQANESKERPVIPYSEFYNQEISEKLNLEDEYILWLKQLEREAMAHGRRQLCRGGMTLVSLCQLPFLLTADGKARILHYEAALQQHQERSQSAMQALFTGVNPVLVGFLDIKVRREHVLEDALNQILLRPRELKKPLRITFISAGREEDAVDEGGVTKEFFQLITTDLFNENYGMFNYNESTRTFWFNLASMESEAEYRLVGIVLGLAIYNGVLLDAHFPLVIYKKLLGLTSDFEDLEDTFPDLAHGLRKLLDFEGDVESTFVQTFTVEYDFFGELRTTELKPGGADIPVTNENRQEYVDLFTQWKLGKSISKQFEAFRSGFYSVCQGPALSLFRYNELELLVCGLPHLNFEDLQRSAVYDGGYNTEHPTIVAFWKVLHSLSLERKKKFLLFATGCDRAPVAGLSKLRLIIQRNGETDRLPTAHTCFNVLLLPDYQEEARVRRMLLLAIENAQGFGLQ